MLFFSASRELGIWWYVRYSVDELDFIEGGVFFLGYVGSRRLVGRCWWPIGMVLGC